MLGADGNSRIKCQGTNLAFIYDNVVKKAESLRLKYSSSSGCSKRFYDRFVAKLRVVGDIRLVRFSKEGGKGIAAAYEKSAEAAGKQSQRVCARRSFLWLVLVLGPAAGPTAVWSRGLRAVA